MKPDNEQTSTTHQQHGVLTWLPFKAGTRFTMSESKDVHIDFEEEMYLPVYVFAEDFEAPKEDVTSNTVYIDAQTAMFGALLGYSRPMIGASLEKVQSFLKGIILLLAEKYYEQDDIEWFLLDTVHWFRTNCSMLNAYKASKSLILLFPDFQPGLSDYLIFNWKMAEEDQDDPEPYLEEVVDTYQKLVLSEIEPPILSTISYLYCASMGLLGLLSTPQNVERFKIAKRLIKDRESRKKLQKGLNEGFSMDNCSIEIT